MTPSTPSVNALTIAMRLLAVRDHSEGELRRKLMFRVEPAFDAADIDAALAYCHEYGWLDDARFAQCYIHGRSRKGYGSQRIVAELLQKGLLRSVISSALLECEIDWFVLAQQVATRKFGDVPPIDWKEKAKQQKYLLTRGFSHDEIQDIYTNFSH
ncbi:MAG: regulatory protein RecX [Symbiopectobacterium sp.]|uniref:regulatory protein RecX n=1 Tax=Symbiopectobacterium sp. TaxID=2952789 RepID=UPI003F31B902